MIWIMLLVEGLPYDLDNVFGRGTLFREVVREAFIEDDKGTIIYLYNTCQKDVQ